MLLPVRSQASAGPTIIGVEQTFQCQHMKSCSSSMERWWWLFQGHRHSKDLTLARSLGFFQQQIVQAVLVSMCKENWEKVSAHVCSSVNKLRLRVFFAFFQAFVLSPFKCSVTTTSWTMTLQTLQLTRPRVIQVWWYFSTFATSLPRLFFLFCYGIVPAHLFCHWSDGGRRAKGLKTGPQL